MFRNVCIHTTIKFILFSLLLGSAAFGSAEVPAKIYRTIAIQEFFYDEISDSGETNVRREKLDSSLSLAYIDSVFPDQNTEIQYFKVVDAQDKTKIGQVFWQYKKNLKLSLVESTAHISNDVLQEIESDRKNSNIQNFNSEDLKSGWEVFEKFGNQKSSTPASSSVRMPLFPNGPFSVGCANFINRTGKYGAWGSYAYNLLQNSKYGRMLSSAFVGNSCPKFSTFSSHKKRDFIAYALAAMSHGESSCNPYIREKRGPNGILSGLFQLHKYKTQNYAYCPRIETRNPTQSVMCVAEMFRFYADRGWKLFDPRSYWDVLRPYSGPGQRTRGLVNRYPGCF